MGALYTLALALEPKIIHHLIRHHEGARANAPELRVADMRTARARRHHALVCHWERAADGSLVAHWVVRGEGDPSREPPDANGGNLLREIPRDLIDAAIHCERRGSVLALIAISRIARLSQCAQYGD